MNVSRVSVDRSRLVPEGSKALPMRCEVCGQRVLVVLPVPITVLSALAESFSRLHEGCER